jgi:hypothetical protein
MLPVGQEGEDLGGCFFDEFTLSMAIVPVNGRIIFAFGGHMYERMWKCPAEERIGHYDIQKSYLGWQIVRLKKSSSNLVGSRYGSLLM